MDFGGVSKLEFARAAYELMFFFSRDRMAGSSALHQPGERKSLSVLRPLESTVHELLHLLKLLLGDHRGMAPNVPNPAFAGIFIRACVELGSKDSVDGTPSHRKSIQGPES